jgi:hypothetical protein
MECHAGRRKLPQAGVRAKTANSVSTARPPFASSAWSGALRWVVEGVSPEEQEEEEEDEEGAEAKSSVGMAAA